MPRRTDSTTPDEAPPCIAFLIVDGMLTSVPFLFVVVVCFCLEDSLTVDLTRMTGVERYGVFALCN